MIKKLIFSLFVMLVSHQSLADDKDAALKSFLLTNLGMQVQQINDAPVAGLKELITDKGVFYSSADGKYLIHGRLFNLNDGLVNETEKTLAHLRQQGLKDFDGATIRFAAENEKYRISVFTDITCGYCRKLHSQIAQYNKLGITVDYLAFPRGGLNSKTYDDLVSIWCAADPKEALTEAKAGENVTAKTCDNKVRSEYEFAVQVGVNATPSIILPDGTLVPGYQTPAQMLAVLNEL
ncbi:bifunctional protein-disulfide isomerase/oxidoreductase DsbC [Neptunicella sp. SCSIO 80796]|uniref:bifunctional protein-disulfide isomerase/oxidoreductase DsbC n=1 Tax=Neptunicella plasticusilytica TaxID=3117012 RepID=UPI003A4D8C02